MKKYLIKSIYKSNQLVHKVINRFKSPIFILMYHRVMNENQNGNPCIVIRSNFEKQMAYLKENFQILNFEDSWSKNHKPSFIITFDDGYFDNYIIAKEVLEPNRIPATFFVTTCNIGTLKLFWWDKLNINKSLLERDKSNKVNDIFKRLKSGSKKDQEYILSKYMHIHPSNEEIYRHYRSMTKQEIFKLSKLDGMSIGAHTVNHLKLTDQTEKNILLELSKSKEFLESITGKKIDICSFPFGNYNKIVLNLCREIGYKKTAIGGHINAYSDTNPYKIPRIPVEDLDLDGFKYLIKSLL